MGKLLGMIVVIIAVIIIVLYLLFGGFGSGSGIGAGTGKALVSTKVEISNDKNNKVSEETTVGRSTETVAETGISEVFVKITIYDNEYFYDNEKTQLDDLMKKIKEKGANVTVEINDEQATKNAVDAFVKELDNSNIKHSYAN